MVDQVWKVGKHPIPLLDINDVDIFKSMHYLEAGCHHIYLVGKNGTFSGYALTAASIRNSWSQGPESVACQPKPVQVAALRGVPFKQAAHEKQVEYLRLILSRFPQQEEIPILDETGKISYVLERAQEAWDIEWSGALFPSELRKCKHIYLSSLGSSCLRDFYQAHGAAHKIQILSNENISDALQNGLILFEKDMLPDCQKKNIIEVAKRFATELHNKQKKEILPLIHIDDKWADIKEKELLDLSQLIERFDEGNHTVSIVDEHGKFKRLINQYEFKVEFPGQAYVSWDNIYVEYEEDESRLKNKLADKFLERGGIGQREIPILKNGKIVAMGRGEHYFDINGCFDSKRIFNIQWSLIDSDVAKEFFSIHKKIMISSDYGFLRDFRNTFSSLVDITVYKDSILSKALAGEYDLIVYDADNFDNFPAEKLAAHRLYCMLLMETVLRWMRQRGISLYFLSSAKRLPGIEKRLDRQGELTGGSISYLREGDNPYFVVDKNSYDSMFSTDEILPNYHSGRRCVTEAEHLSGRGIYFFGFCASLGFATYNPHKTIESFLQKRLNQEHLDGHVVNCSTEGLTENVVAYLNWLYRLIDTPFSSGDIVVLLTNPDYLFGVDSRFKPADLYEIAEPFLYKENLNKKCFVDPHVPHMNVRGYEIIADYIFHIIKHELKNEDVYKNSPKKSSFQASHTLSSNPCGHLSKWMQLLPKPLQAQYASAGALILSAGPISEYHLHLIDSALLQCDFLYIFILQSKESKNSSAACQEKLSGMTQGKPIHILATGLCMRQTVVYYTPAKSFVSSMAEKFDPVYDTYTFARYIAPHLNIRKYFSICNLDKLERCYNIIRQEILMEENISYVELRPVSD